MSQRLSLAGIALLLIASLALADDWPQFRGPKRDGITAEKNLLTAWPKKGPTLVWSYKNAGLGFSSFAVVDGVAYTLGTRGEEEVVIALDAVKGTEMWTAKIGPTFTSEDNVAWGDGPRSTPTVDGKRLYALGSQGELVCLDLSASKPAESWRKNLNKDLGGEMMTGWGNSESPLVDGKLVVVTPGGPKGTLAALDRMTGAVVWRSTELTHLAPYSSIMPADIHGVRQYIQTSYIDEKEGGFVSGIAAKDGKLLWSQRLFKRHSYAIAPNPIIKGNRVYVTSGYGGGCHLFEIDKNQKAKERYSKDTQKNFKNTHGGVVLLGDHIFGHSEDIGWACQKLETGEIDWDDRNELECGSGATISADGMLYLYTDKGVAGLAKVDVTEFKVIGSFRIPEQSKFPATRTSSKSARPWAHPAIANGYLYLRDAELIFCYDIRDKK